jgi:Uma2 family endonuclease
MNAPVIPPNALQKAKLTVDDFLALHERGAFDAYAKVELIEEEIYCANATYSQHGLTQFELGFELKLGLKQMGSELRVYTAISIRMPDSAPEPDIVIARPNQGEMMQLARVALAVEVSDSTLDFDLTRKVALYAREGIPEYWVADIEHRKLHQFWSPDGEVYKGRREVVFGTRIESETIAGLGTDSTSF